MNADYELINNIQYLKKYSPSITLIKSKLKEISIYSFPRLGGDIFLFIYSAFPVFAFVTPTSTLV